MNKFKRTNVLKGAVVASCAAALVAAPAFASTTAAVSVQPVKPLSYGAHLTAGVAQAAYTQYLQQLAQVNTARQAVAAAQEKIDNLRYEVTQKQELIEKTQLTNSQLNELLASLPSQESLDATNKLLKDQLANIAELEKKQSTAEALVGKYTADLQRQGLSEEGKALFTKNLEAAKADQEAAKKAVKDAKTKFYTDAKAFADEVSPVFHTMLKDVTIGNFVSTIKNLTPWAQKDVYSKATEQLEAINKAVSENNQTVKLVQYKIDALKYSVAKVEIEVNTEQAKLASAQLKAQALELAYGFVAPNGLGDVQAAHQTGWAKNQDGTWSFYKNNFDKATGWVKDNGTWYYLNNDGVMQKGWVEVEGTWYYLNGSGAMQTGWVKDGGSWYYLNGSGAMQTGWVKVAGQWYFLNGSGAMQTGWVKDGGSWYWLNASGAWA